MGRNKWLLESLVLLNNSYTEQVICVAKVKNLWGKFNEGNEVSIGRVYVLGPACVCVSMPPSTCLDSRHSYASINKTNVVIQHIHWLWVMRCITEVVMEHIWNLHRPLNKALWNFFFWQKVRYLYVEEGSWSIFNIAQCMWKNYYNDFAKSVKNAMSEPNLVLQTLPAFSEN